MPPLRFLIPLLLLCLGFQAGFGIHGAPSGASADEGWLLTSCQSEHFGVPLRKPRLAVLQADEENVREEKQALRTAGNFTAEGLHYNYLPVFSEENQHFLLHYAAAHKGKLGRLYLWHESFLI